MEHDPNTRTVQQLIRVALLDENRAVAELDASFEYEVADPYAVRVVFLVPERPTTWTFARDRLVDGYFEPTGEGDVHVFPCLGSDGGAVVLLDLSGPGGEALFQIESRVLEGFLRATLAVVPLGTESDRVDLDAELADDLLALDTGRFER
jgi:hypothetical protein